MIGILGGSFDPVHQGHIHLALEVAHALQLEHVCLIPCAQNALKPKTPVASNKDRLTMLKLAIQNHPNLLIDTIELDRGGISYTIDTLRTLKQRAPSTKLYLIMASDTARTLTQWKEWQLLTKYAHLIIAPRPGEKRLLERTWLTHVQHLNDDNVLFFETTHANRISSTKIRAWIQKGDYKRASPYLDKAVLEYIEEHRLYLS